MATPAPLSMTKAAAAPTLPSLYDLEETLLALIDTEDMTPDDQKEAIRAEIVSVMCQTVEKRNAVYRFLTALQAQQTSMANEIKRLQERKTRVKNAETRLRDYIRRVIMLQEPDIEGKYKPLKCELCTFGVRAGQTYLDVPEPEKLDDKYKVITVTLPLPLWRELVETAPAAALPRLQLSQEMSAIQPDQLAIKKALEAGASYSSPEGDLVPGIPGVVERTGEYSLTVR